MARFVTGQAHMAAVTDDRLRDMLLGQAAATVSARALIATATGRA